MRLNKLRINALVLLALFSTILQAQELYIYTDPASNVPAHALSLRLNNMLMPMADMNGGKVNETNYRFSPELMYGVNKNLMFKLSGYASDMFQPQFKFEGASLYSKYRFYSNDDFHKHFRMAGFGKLAISSNPYQMESTVVHQRPDGAHEEKMVHSADEQNLEGNHSGWQVGLVATQLIHKLAISSTLSGIGRFDNTNFPVLNQDVQSALQYTLSAGYLLFPRNYESYGQTNINLYVELIGQSAFGKPVQFFDAAPAIQFIFNSKARLDLAYRFQVSGNMKRFNDQQALLRFEYNWLQAFRGKGDK